MKAVKVIFNQALLVNFCMNCVLILTELISYLSSGEVFNISWYIPFSLVLVSILTAIPTAVFYIWPDISAKHAKIRNVIHFILLGGIVTGSGYFFHWYRGWVGFLTQLLSYIIIYVLVCVFTKFMFKHDEKLINAALDEIRDEE